MNYSWSVDNFDTQIFGCKIAKITNILQESHAARQDDIIRSLLEDLSSSAVAYATYRLNARNFGVIHALERAGFFLVDGLISLECKLSQIGPLDSSEKVREARDSDKDTLEKIAANSFLENRFHHDPNFPDKSAIPKFYKAWTANALSGEASDLVLVYEEGGKVSGFIALEKRGHIVLLAVDESSRGKRVGTALIHTSLSFFRKWGVSSVKIETVMTNIPALRAYESCGFSIIDSHLTYRWSANV